MLTASNGGGNGLGPRSSGPFTPIARQPSIYSLTLDELQNTYEPGKNFGSMNMDEFLKNIWTAEESQAMASALASTNEANNPQPSSGGVSGVLARQGSLARQASLPGTLSRKTVDEVWKDIQRGSSQKKTKEKQDQTNYGEMTLEDFLVKAGVVREESEETEATTSAPPADAPSHPTGNFPFRPGGGSGGAFGGATSLARVPRQATMEAIAAQNQQQSWLNYQLKTAQLQQHQHQHHFLQQQAAEAAAAAFANATKRGGPPLVALPGTSSGSGMDGSSDGGIGHGNGLSLSPAINTPDTPTRGKKRNHEGVVEKTVERRQRRMIKNRESAARSRARKQAYTVELEAEVTQLKEENTRLKKQQILENLIPITASPPQKKVLRRTKTNPW